MLLSISHFFLYYQCCKLPDVWITSNMELPSKTDCSRGEGLGFLAHLNWKPKWVFLIACCPSSVCLPACKLFKFFTISTSVAATWLEYCRYGVKTPNNHSINRLLVEPPDQIQPNLAQSILGWRESSLFKWRAMPFSKEWNHEMAKILLQNSKFSFSRTASQTIQIHWCWKLLLL